MILTHVRVPGRSSPERLLEIRESYTKGTLDLTRMLHGGIVSGIVFDERASFWISARYSHLRKKTDDHVRDLAEHVNEVVRESIKVGMDEVVIVTDAQFVLSVMDARGVSKSTDHLEAKVRANASFFSSELWTVHTAWRFKSWSFPRFAIYDYDGNDGRKVWSWVLHLGPWWFIRERYAL